MDVYIRAMLTLGLFGLGLILGSVACAMVRDDATPPG